MIDDDPTSAVIGRPLRDELPESWQLKIHSSESGSVLQVDVIPWDPDEARAFFEHGANEYQVVLKADEGRRVTEIVYRVDQHPHSDISFAPKRAPAWLFGPDARFTIEWEDVAPEGQRRIVGWIEAIVGLAETKET